MATDPLPHKEIERRIKRIDELAQAARSSWFVLLGALAFAAIAVAGVADRDFFLADVSTELPIVGVSVPTVAFFVTAPIILLAVYANLHFYILKLWTALSEVPLNLPTDDPGRTIPLAEALQPWLLVDAAIALKPGSTPAAFSRLSQVVSLFLTWGMGPLVLAAFWFRSWPLHHLLLSVFLAGLVVLAIGLGFATFSLGRDALRANSGAPVLLRRRVIGVAAGFALVFTALVGATLAATKVHLHATITPETEDDFLWLAWLGPWHADLYRAEIADRPTDWIPRRQAEAAFLGNDKDPDAVAKLREAFTEQRNHFLLSFTASDLTGADLRWADLRYAFLPAVLMEFADLRDAQLYSAQLEGAHMKGADLSHAKLNSTELSCARLPGATLNDATMHSVRLHRAEMSRVRMQRAVLRNADLSKADLSHSDLTGARFLGADLTGADLHLANLRGADLSKAVLTDANLNGAIGDKNTKLPSAMRPLARCYASLNDTEIASMARWWGMGADAFRAEFVCKNSVPGGIEGPAAAGDEPERCWPLVPSNERD